MGKKGTAYSSVTPGWVRRVVDRGVQQAMLILRATNLYATNIYDKTGALAPIFPNGLKSATLSEETAAGGITFPHKAVFSNATINMANLPTAAGGLASGDLWNDSGTIKVIP